LKSIIYAGHFLKGFPILVPFGLFRIGKGFIQVSILENQRAQVSTMPKRRSKNTIKTIFGRLFPWVHSECAE
jgi:hypothetical protein